MIADEAHSSQSGSASRQLKELLTDVELDAGEDDVSSDDLLLASDTAIAKSSTITFVALTATPKAKTLRLFGTEREGRWEAFDTYTMAQAIEEGFIHDVLSNYSTYDMFLPVKIKRSRVGVTRVRFRSTPVKQSPASFAMRVFTRQQLRKRSELSSNIFGAMLWTCWLAKLAPW